MPSPLFNAQSHLPFGHRERAEKAERNAQSILDQAALSVFVFPKPADHKEAELQAVARQKILNLLKGGEEPFDFTDVIQSGEDIDAILGAAGYQGEFDSRASRVRISKKDASTENVGK